MLLDVYRKAEAKSNLARGFLRESGGGSLLTLVGFMASLIPIRRSPSRMLVPPPCTLQRSIVVEQENCFRRPDCKSQRRIPEHYNEQQNPFHSSSLLSFFVLCLCPPIVELLTEPRASEKQEVVITLTSSV